MVVPSLVSIELHKCRFGCCLFVDFINISLFPTLVHDSVSAAETAKLIAPFHNNALLQGT
jgi:hypothetical protein